MAAAYGVFEYRAERLTMPTHLYIHIFSPHGMHNYDLYYQPTYRQEAVYEREDVYVEGLVRVFLLHCPAFIATTIHGHGWPV